EEEEDTDPNHIYLLDGRLMVVDIGSGASENIGYYSQWAGKRVAWYGDSLTELYYHCSLVNQYFGLAAYNCGTRGATVSTHTVSALCTKIRMKLYIGYIPSDVEAIFIMAGTNDWMQNVPLGTKILTRDATGAVNTDSTTFYGACHLMFSHLRELYPNAKIVVFGTPMAMNADGLYNALGLSAADYGNAMCEIANMWGIENFNIGECIQVNLTNCVHGDGYMYEQLHFLEIPSRRAADAIIQKLCTTPYQEGR
nr:SGNH/GDSL hydrolase family protein [Lachnospiraceae bacterium]